MPERAQLATDDFSFIEEELIKLGYVRRIAKNVKMDFIRLGLVAPREIKGREASFITYNHGLNSLIWVSYDEVHKEWREVDLGWGLIRKGDKRQYCSKPLRRTPNFIQALLKRARVNKWRVDNRPLCPYCGAYMDIYERKDKKDKKPTGQYLWACFKRDKHENKEPVFVGWDKIGSEKKLPAEIEDYVLMMRKRVADYKERNRKLGIVRTPARFIRKPWGMTKPDNQI